MSSRVTLPENYNHIVFGLVRRTGAAVISVDYSLAPERLFPTPIDEYERVVVEIYEQRSD